MDVNVLKRLERERARLQPVRVEKDKVTYTSKAGRYNEAENETKDSFAVAIKKACSDERRQQALEKSKLIKNHLLRWSDPQIYEYAESTRTALLDIVYIAYHIPSKMRYVGQTKKNIVERIKEHYYARRQESATGLSFFFLLNDNLEDWYFTPLTAEPDQEKRECIEIGMIKLTGANLNLHLYNSFPTERPARHRPRRRRESRRRRVAMTGQEIHVADIENALRMGLSYKEKKKNYTYDPEKERKYQLKLGIVHPMYEGRLIERILKAVQPRDK